ncbi:MAG: GTPase Era [Bacilli bacterium]|nr:GTPase Era [Bacilli bacterium]
MKSGFVAILGRPNVGKSTLLNHILHKKVSIVTDKSQTTRNTIKGIYTDEEVQIVFVDTPGIHKPLQKLGEEMNIMAYKASHDVDAAILVVDASLPFGKGDEYLFNHLALKDIPLIVVFNKIDQARLNKVEELKKIYREEFKDAKFIDTVAIEGFNVDEIVGQLKEMLPEGPMYYDKETVTDQDLVFQIKEIIREKILNVLSQEVPHSCAIYMDDIAYESNPMHIRATIIVEKDSQKGIVIGAEGKRIREIGSKARQSIEALVKKHVFLELFVRVEKDWRNQEKELIKFGYKNKNEE